MKIRILLGGSPCTVWSKARRDGREVDAEETGWNLFQNYLAAKRKFAPDIFLYENNKSISMDIKNEIAVSLGIKDSKKIEMTYINSALVSAQNRECFYVTNFGKILQPENRGLRVADVLDTVIPGSTGTFPLGTVGEKSYALKAQYGKNGIVNFVKPSFQATGVVERVDRPLPEYRTHLVENGTLTLQGTPYQVPLDDGYYVARKLTVNECCRLQTLPDGYCDAVSAVRGYTGIGNGWTAEVVIHLLNSALESVSRDDEITILSLYDGIGTGRYCLDKMGFRNVRYYAYEIDQYAMAIASSNYPDIIQCGDAFQLKKYKWHLPE